MLLSLQPYVLVDAIPERVSHAFYALSCLCACVYGCVPGRGIKPSLTQVDLDQDYCSDDFVLSSLDRNEVGRRDELKVTPFATDSVIY